MMGKIKLKELIKPDYSIASSIMSFALGYLGLSDFTIDSFCDVALVSLLLISAFFVFDTIMVFGTYIFRNFLLPKIMKADIFVNNEKYTLNLFSICRVLHDSITEIEKSSSSELDKNWELVMRNQVDKLYEQAFHTAELLNAQNVEGEKSLHVGFNAKYDKEFVNLMNDFLKEVEKWREGNYL